MNLDTGKTPGRFGDYPRLSGWGLSPPVCYPFATLFSCSKSQRFGSSAFFVASINGILFVIAVQLFPVTGDV